jgi:PAS domain S-box-containing protein
MALPIRSKLTAMMLLTSAAILLVTCVAFIAYDYVTFRRNSLEQTGTLGRIIATNSTAALAFRNREDAEEVLAALKGEPQILAAALYDKEGRLFARYPQDAPDALFPPTPGAEGYEFKDGFLSGFQPVSEHAGMHLGDLFVYSDMSGMYDRLRQYGLIAAVVFAFAFLLAYVLARVLQGRISKPILALTDTARAISERADYSVRAPMEGEAEFQVLTGAFNQMLAQIGAQNAAVRDSEERMRAVLNSALSAVVLMDADGVIIDWNSCAERIFGWSRAEAVGRQLADTIIPPRYREGHRAGLRRFVVGAESKIINQTLEMWAVRRDGSLFPVELSISVLTGSTTTFCGFITDITERAEARSRVQTQIARLDLLQRTTRAIGERQDLHSIFQVIVRNLEDNLPIDFGCVCLYDGETRKLIVASMGAKSSMFAHALGLFPKSEIPIEENGLTACINGKLVHEPDLAGTPFPFSQNLARAGLTSLVAAPLLVESKVFGVLIAARTKQHGFSSADCEFLRQLSEHVALASHQVQLYTALQQAYEELRQSQQTILQQERLRALGQMASGIAHDINNAISPVALYTESLLEREPNLSQRTRDYLTTIRRSIDDVAQTVARMREFYRQRDPQSNLTAVDLNPAVQQVLHLTQARWRDVPQERGIVITARTELAADLPRIMGTESDIRDALTNLVFNAVDAMPGGGALTIRTRTVAKDDPNAPPMVELAVIDSGAGMDEETRRRCLEPFFTTKGERGTGMGLAMVYGMVKRHSAQIEIESALGRGTTMRLLFDAAPADVASPVARPAAIRPLRRLRLLVVDDDPLLTRSLSHTLEADGHLVTIADGGKAGIDIFEATCSAGDGFDVVITDLGMPYVDGRAVAASVKKGSAETPVLLLTGWGQRLNMEQTVPPCVDRVLSKPPSLQELRKALVELTEAHGTAERV